MNGITILIWITIAIIGVIAIIVVRLHYGGKQLENDEGSILEDAGSITKLFSESQNKLSKNENKSKPAQLNKSKSSSFKSKIPSFSNVFEEPEPIEVKNDNNQNVEYKSENQVLINYDNTVEKFQEPIKQSQMDIMTKNNKPTTEKHELKDLFTIDELIKESKRKDSEREKEALKSDEPDEELKNSRKASNRNRKKRASKRLSMKCLKKPSKTS